MDQISGVLEREVHVLEILLFKLVETRLLLENDEIRFLTRATREVERARLRAREVDLLRATTVSEVGTGRTLRTLAASAPAPWPGILRDHHAALVDVVAQIELTAHRNAELARVGLDRVERTKVIAGAGHRTAEDDRAELDRLATGAAFQAVLGTAGRLRMPDLLDFIR